MKMNREAFDEQADRVIDSITDAVDDHGNIHYRRVRYLLGMDTEDGMLVKDLARDTIRDIRIDMNLPENLSDIEIQLAHTNESIRLVKELKGKDDSGIDRKAQLERYETRVAEMRSWLKSHGFPEPGSAIIPPKTRDSY